MTTRQEHKSSPSAPIGPAEEPSDIEVCLIMPPAKAFVLRFADGTDLGAGRITGRVEHIVSGTGERFSSPADVWDFLQRMLEGQERAGRGPSEIS